MRKYSNCMLGASESPKTDLAISAVVAQAKRFVNMHISSNICSYNKDLFYLRNKLLYLWFGHWRPRNKLCSLPLSRSLALSAVFNFLFWFIYFVGQSSRRWLATHFEFFDVYTCMQVCLYVWANPIFAATLGLGVSNKMAGNITNFPKQFHQSSILIFKIISTEQHTMHTKWNKMGYAKCIDVDVFIRIAVAIELLLVC